MSTFTDPMDTAPSPPEFDEDIAKSFARLLAWLADECGGYMFAADLAEKGMTPGVLRMMADRWISCDFDHPEAADVLREFADALAAD